MGYLYQNILAINPNFVRAGKKIIIQKNLFILFSELKSNEFDILALNPTIYWRLTRYHVHEEYKRKGGMYH